MLRTMKSGDQVTVTLAGQTHQFGPDRVRVAVVDTAPKGGPKTRYATITIELGDEFPEDLTDHLTRLREG
jgi:hypothetical protein